MIITLPISKKEEEKQVGFLKETLASLAIAGWIDEIVLLLMLMEDSAFFSVLFFLIEWIMLCMPLIIFSIELSLSLTMHSSDALYSFFTEEVVSNFWGEVGLLDKLLALLSLIVFLVECSVITGKLLALLDLVLFFVFSLIMQWSFFDSELRLCDRNLDDGPWSLKWILVSW